MTTRDPLDYGWWLASRSAGVIAFLALSLSVLAGLTMALRLGSPRSRVALRATHERIALLALAAIGAHGLLLLGDTWLKAGVSGLLIPFTMSYRPVWTGIGVLATYLATALSLSYYARARLGRRRWRLAHRFIPIAWGLAAVHVIGAGTDSGSLWLVIPLAATMSGVLTLLSARLLASGRARRPAADRAAPGPTAADPAPTVAAPLFERAAGEPAPAAEPERLWASGA